MSEKVWHPFEKNLNNLQITYLMKKSGLSNYEDFYSKSIEDIDWFWQEMVEYLNLVWRSSYNSVSDQSNGIMWTKWFKDGKLNITETLLDQKALKYPNSIAIIYESEDGFSKSLTYAKLLSEVNKLSKGLVKMNIKPGDRVAIYLPMVVENIIAMLAVMRIGAIFIPCFSGFGADALSSRINDSQANLLITANNFKRNGKLIDMKKEVDRAVDLSPSLINIIFIDSDIYACDGKFDVKYLSWNEVMDEFDHFEPIIVDSSHPAMIIYTSGTTGKPKGTIHTHTGFPIKSATDAILGMDLKFNDTLLWFTDMGWMMGPWMVFSTLMTGSTMFLYDGSPVFPRADRLWELVSKHKVTHLGVSPTLIRSLMKYPHNLSSNYDLGSLNVFASSGEPWNPSPWEWLFDVVGERRIPIWNYSGGTEISGGILGSVLIKPIHPCSFNTPMPGMDVDIVDIDGSSLQNKVGELVIKKPWVGMTMGFWNDFNRYKESYWNRWPNIWVHGDWAKVDQENNWFILGRSDDTINVAGKRLGPAEMESILVSHPAVSEAATIGIPDEIKGEAPISFVILNRDIASPSNQELISYVAKHLGKAFAPKNVYIVDELPKTRNGKILRRVIKNIYLSEPLGDISTIENPRSLQFIKFVVS